MSITGIAKEGIGCGLYKEGSYEPSAKRFNKGTPNNRVFAVAVSDLWDAPTNRGHPLINLYSYLVYYNIIPGAFQ